MHDDRWWGWLGLVILLVIFQGLRALFRGVKNAQSGTARMNAAAERILRERGASVANPLPRTTPHTRNQIAAKPRSHPAVMKTGSTPAVVRRGSLLSGGKEPVVQRRR